MGRWVPKLQRVLAKGNRKKFLVYLSLATLALIGIAGLLNYLGNRGRSTKPSYSSGSDSDGTKPVTDGEPFTRQISVIELADGQLDEASTASSSSAVLPRSVEKDKLAIAFVWARDTGGQPHPVLSGGGVGQWDQIGNTNDDSDIDDSLGRIYAFRGVGDGSRGASVTIDFGAGNNHSAISWWIGEIDGAKIGNNGADAINQAVFVGNSPNSTSHTVSLQQFADPTNNAVFQVVYHGQTDGGFYAENGFTLLKNQADTKLGGSFGVQWKLGEDTTPTLAWVTKASNLALALEIAGLQH